MIEEIGNFLGMLFWAITSGNINISGRGRLIK